MFQGPVADEEYPQEISIHDYTNLYNYMRIVIRDFPHKVTTEMKLTILHKIDETISIFRGGVGYAENILGTEKMEGDFSEHIAIFEQMKELFNQ
jgi:hypothetical protein